MQWNMGVGDLRKVGCRLVILTHVAERWRVAVSREVAEGLGKEWSLIEGFWGISSALCGELSLTKHWGHGEIASWDLLLWAKKIPKYFSKVHTSDESRLGLVRGKGQGGHISR